MVRNTYNRKDTGEILLTKQEEKYNWQYKVKMQLTTSGKDYQQNNGEKYYWQNKVRNNWKIKDEKYKWQNKVRQKFNWGRKYQKKVPIGIKGW